MSDINLIPQDERDSQRNETIQKKLQFASIGFLVVTAVLTVVTLSLFAATSSARSKLVAQQQDASSKINRYKSQEELVVVAKDKAAIADKLVGTRVDFTKFFQKFAPLIPQGVYFTDIRVNNGKVVFSGRAKTSADVAGFVSSLTSNTGREIISDLSVDSLSSDENGNYSFVASAKVIGFAAPSASGAAVGATNANPAGGGLK